MMRFSIGTVLAFVLALSGCSGGQKDADKGVFLNAGAAMLEQAKARIKGGGKKAPVGRVVITRALLDQTPGAVMEVIPDRSGLQDFLALIETRNDPYPGTVEVWKSTDNAQLIFRDGVLISTKGLGGEIRSASAQSAINGFDGQGGGGQREYTLDRLDGTAQRVEFACDVTQLGRETIRIVDRAVATYHLKETCVAGSARIENEYWVETGSGRVRKSRQWGGPVIGYFNLLRLQG